MLTLIKTLHTVVWALFAGSIVALPIAAMRKRFRLAGILTALVLFECAVLAVNGGRCPLSDIASRYTADRRDNFDIYLPLWLARYNKEIFGTWFVAGEIVASWLWLRSRATSLATPASLPPDSAPSAPSSRQSPSTSSRS
jgi:hypothetical protein